MTIPIIDLAEATERRAGPVAHAIDDACRSVGFFAIRNTGVPDHVLDGAWDAARDFFDRPLEERLAVRAPHAGYPYGYAPYKAEGLAHSLGNATPADLKESYSCNFVAPPRGSLADPDEAFVHSPNIWPCNPPGFAQALEAYYGAMSDLAARLMRQFALALDLPWDFFEPAIDRHVSGLRVLNYPEPAAGPEPGQIRAGAHTDYGSLTILRQDAAPGGLQVMAADGNWTDVPALADSLVVNLGDLMQRWTNDRWRSTLHRVVNPPPDTRGRSRRQSIAFFHQPNWDARIACIPSCLAPGEAPHYAPIASGPHLMTKFRSTVEFSALSEASPLQGPDGAPA